MSAARPVPSGKGRAAGSVSILLPPAFVAEEGFSLIEVMLAMVVLAFALLGSMAMFQWADHGLQVGANGTHALAMATTRLEAKRAVSWDALLTDDLDSDGRPEIEMRDDGAGTDAEAGDGVYSASVEDGGIRLMWTVELQQGPSLRTAGSAVIQVRASYPVGRGKRRELQVETLRANPRYLGAW